MDEIYSAASEVIVWLGPADADFESWLWVNTELVDALKKWRLAHSFQELRLQKPLDPGFTSQLGVTPPGGSWTACWRKYFNFFRRRAWFSRVWVVQEVALAKQVVFQCGPRRLAWINVIWMGSLLQMTGWQVELWCGCAGGIRQSHG